jgi:hypothetical protein
MSFTNMVDTHTRTHVIHTHMPFTHTRTHVIHTHVPDTQTCQVQSILLARIKFNRKHRETLQSPCH